MSSTALSLALALSLTAGGSGAGEHLLAGARLFRDGRFPEALVEFRVSQKLGAPEAAPYVGASLVKLNRPEEAVEAFGGAEGGSRDALLDYYLALACYESRLYLAADRILAGIGGRSGPRIAEQAAKLRSSIAGELGGREPPRSAVDWYLARCEAAGAQGRAALAEAYCREAAGLGARRADRYGAEGRGPAQPASAKSASAKSASAKGRP
ncbi:hypothetical protein [Anaeromyxobacter paludicola]|uniref:Tetratricopeptide repeat protein n=1 Tax=Anaeromyxobacter paludicola TaxID=2918171 RepID=A0ABM7XDT3_9BACT|nr:hypothetical protein [Anaeromyxobacter paludicola]BDG10045.1 hypothetical protein AMPC_31580 [Anaeromyxobacter paludicola]